MLSFIIFAPLGVVLVSLCMTSAVNLCRRTVVIIISKEAIGNCWNILNVILGHTFQPNSQSPGEIKRREVELDSRESSGEIKGREVELGSHQSPSIFK